MWSKSAASVGPVKHPEGFVIILMSIALSKRLLWAKAKSLELILYVSNSKLQTLRSSQAASVGPVEDPEKKLFWA